MVFNCTGCNINQILRLHFLYTKKQNFPGHPQTKCYNATLITIVIDFVNTKLVYLSMFVSSNKDPPLSS